MHRLPSRPLTHPSMLRGCWLMFLIPCCAPLAHGWGEVGHTAVALVAQNFLTAEASSATQRLLDGGRLADVATWADQIREVPDMKWTKPLHYVNVAEGEKNFDLARDCNPTSGCVVSAIIDCTRILRSTTETTEIRQRSLKLLIHFVGDVHQPLHVSRAADRGGNTIMVSYKGTTMTLHHLWDAGLIGSQYNSGEELSEELLHAITPDLYDQWCSLDPVAWADASYQYAISNAYQVPAGGVIDDAYDQRNLPIIRMRLAQAGVRLAALLNQIFAAKPAPRAQAPAAHWPAVVAVSSLH